MTFNDIFKSSFLDSVSEFSLLDTLIGLAAALGVGTGSPLHAGQALRALLQVFGGKGGGRADSAFGRCDSMDIPRAAAILTELCGGAVPIDTTEA